MSKNLSVLRYRKQKLFRPYVHNNIQNDIRTKESWWAIHKWAAKYLAGFSSCRPLQECQLNVKNSRLANKNIHNKFWIKMALKCSFFVLSFSNLALLVQNQLSLLVLFIFVVKTWNKIHNETLQVLHFKYIFSFHIFLYIFASHRRKPFWLII